MAQDPLIERLRWHQGHVRSYVKLKAKVRNPVNSRTGLPLKPATIRYNANSLETYRDLIQSSRSEIRKLLRKPKAERLQEAEDQAYRFNVVLPISLAIGMHDIDSRYLFEMLRRSSPKDALIVLDRLAQVSGRAEEVRKMLTAAGHFKKRLEIIQGGAA
jgi:hypothetical protein